MTEPRTKRCLVLIEMDLPRDEAGAMVTSDLRDDLVDANPNANPVVWGIVQGVDAAYRKIRQLARETEQDASIGDRMHSAQKAMSFFRDMFPGRFWNDKQIGEPHPEGGVIDERTGQRVVR